MPRRPAKPGERVLWFSLAAAAAAAWLSFGPFVRTFGRQVADGPYLLLYRYVPGFDGLRVPARYGMVVLVFLAVLTGLGAWDLERRWRRGRLLVAAAGALFLLEATAVPLDTNRRDSAPDFQAPPPRVFTGRDVPAVYGYLAGLPAGAAVIEFPFGEPTFEVDYVFYSTTHWRRLVNGYSGGFPASYARRRSVLRHPLENPEFAWREVASSGATHAVVHEAYFLESEGRAISDWVREHGGREVAMFKDDRVYEVR